jgi:dTDP-glucose 4,6-dehydratase
MNLLITGGAGFIGSNLIRFLIGKPGITKLVNLDCLTYAGHLENLTEIESHQSYVFEQVDLRDKEAVLRVVNRHDITHVVHLAAESHVDRSITGPAEFIHTNILGTFHLLETCRSVWMKSAEAIGACRFLHVSTDEVYGSLGAEGYFSETSSYAPNSPYAASKASSDLLVRAHHQTYALPAIITNCSNNYGPYQHPEKLIPVVIQSILQRSPIPIYGDGLNQRDWLHVEDHCQALWLILNQGRLGETYCIGGDNEQTNLSLVSQICEVVDELHPNPAGDSKSLITSVQDRPGHDRRYAIDHTKLTHELGWAPSHTFASGLRETVQWYLNNQEWVGRVCPSLQRDFEGVPSI